jgi:crossover junction endodeoxyribonuclease RuvC
VILEDGFVGVNSQSSLKLAQLRGALIAYFKYQGRAVIHQLPSEIRKNFRLAGNANKEEVAKEVLKYYPFLTEQIGPYSDKANKNKTSDIYDAISIGLSYVINLKE